MNGLQLAKEYYESYGQPMLHEVFKNIEGVLAIGLAGSGSECFGYDDEISTDHDFEPCFQIFLPGEGLIDNQVAFKLERAYAKLPKEFKGYKRNIVSPVGGSRHGVIRISDFYISKCGSADGELTLEQWLCVPESALAEAVNGEIFKDEYGLFTEIRNRLKHYPEDIRLKKLAGYLLKAQQSGQYNYNRCISRNDTAAAQLCVYEFVDAVLHIIYLLNNRYMPYYKWSFRGLRDLKILGELYDSLEFLISTDNSAENAQLKSEMIEDIATLIINELKDNDLSAAICSDLEKHAYSVNDKIKNVTVRNMNIFAGI